MACHSLVPYPCNLQATRPPFSSFVPFVLFSFATSRVANSLAKGQKQRFRFIFPLSLSLFHLLCFFLSFFLFSFFFHLFFINYSCSCSVVMPSISWRCSTWLSASEDLISVAEDGPSGAGAIGNYTQVSGWLYLQRLVEKKSS